ncbi:EF-hand domain-containing protein [Rubritalea tangerina]|uniref:EF-hand domain-containing protein n=1 Tax=Rubritalea tangerina TaxID=430798 RepID=A0ABW4ZDK5_9BACT
MKRALFTSSISIIGIAFALPVMAQGPANGERSRPSREDLLKRFDADGDGSISEEERRAMREARAERAKPGFHGDRERGDWRKRSAHGGRFDKEVMERFDKDGDGKLSDEERKEARDAIAKRYGSRGDKMQKELLKRFDKDGDGKLSEDERRELRRSWEKRKRGHSEWMEQAKKRFMLQFDEDGDGQLSEEEKAKAKEVIAERMSELKKELIEKYDLDGDGTLSEEERKTAHEKEKAEMLERFDADGDGTLNAEEKQKAMEHMMEHAPFRLMHQLRQGGHGKKPHHHRGERRDSPSPEKRGGRDF